MSKTPASFGPINNLVDVRVALESLRQAINKISNVDNTEALTEDIARLNASVLELQTRSTHVGKLEFTGHLVGAKFDGSVDSSVATDGTPANVPGTLVARGGLGIPTEFGEILAHEKLMSDGVFDRNDQQLLTIQQPAIADAVATVGSPAGTHAILGLDADPATKGDVRVALTAINDLEGVRDDLLASVANLITTLNAYLTSARTHGWIDT